MLVHARQCERQVNGRYKMDDFPDEFYKAFGIKKIRYPRSLVEDCEVIIVSTPGIFRRFPISHTATQLRPGVFRDWFECPQCTKRSFKLYRPPGAKLFACRKCNHLVYTSSLKRNPDGSPKRSANPKPRAPIQEEELMSDSGHMSSPAPTKWIPNPGHPIWKMP